MRHESRVKREKPTRCLLSNFYLNMFQASLCPSSGEQECALPHMVFCNGCDGCGCVELGRELCALWRLLFDFTVHTARVPAPHNHSHHNQCRIPYAAVHTLVLMVGIMMPETCWDKSLIINIGLVASCWFLSLHPIYLFIYLFTSLPWNRVAFRWCKTLWVNHGVNHPHSCTV